MLNSSKIGQCLADDSIQFPGHRRNHSLSKMSGPN